MALGVQHFLCGWLRLFDGRNFPSETPFAVIPCVPAYPWLAYLIGLILLIAGCCLIANIRPRTMATLLGILFLFFVIVLEASIGALMTVLTLFLHLLILTLAHAGSTPEINEALNYVTRTHRSSLEQPSYWQQHCRDPDRVEKT